jgi:hypothetical protein
MSYTPENKKIKNNRKPMWRLADFKDWNMYKNYLDHHGLLILELNYTPVDWQSYLKKLGKNPDLMG